MGFRLAGWAALSWRDRRRLIGCTLGLPLVHASLGLFGYTRTRRMIETLTQRASTREAAGTEITDAQATARLAAIAGRHGLVSASCLRQALLLYGWLRWRGLQPSLKLGVTHLAAPFQAHAWIELSGEALLHADAEHHAFTNKVT